MTIREAEVDDRTCAQAGVISPSAGIAAAPLPFPKRDASGRVVVLIFDWDDTLLCSSAIRSLFPSADLMRQLERAVEAILLTAMSLGETMIVTNGTESWVKDSATRFLPGLLPLLDAVTSISARAKYEHQFPEDPYAWKRETFRELLGNRRAPEVLSDLPCMTGQDDDGVVDLVVVGDSWYEIQAARSTMGRPEAPATIKTVKFKEAPTVQELLGQLRRSGQELARLVEDRGNASYGLVLKPLPSHPKCLIACASAWALSPEQVNSDSTWSSAFIDQQPCYLGVAGPSLAFDHNKPGGIHDSQPTAMLPQLQADGTYRLAPVESRACGWVF